MYGAKRQFGDFPKDDRGRSPQPPIAERSIFVWKNRKRDAPNLRGTSKSNYYNPLGTTHGGYIATCSIRQWAARYSQRFRRVKVRRVWNLKLISFARFSIKPERCEPSAKLINAGKQIVTAEARTD
jgi:hypothetical protein